MKNHPVPLSTLLHTISNEFSPKLFKIFKKGITRKELLNDILSGTIVGIIALPLSIAFATAANLPPERGLITAIVAGFLISFLGGSRFQIGGPTGAFLVLVSSITLKYGIEGLLISTFMAGIILILLGVLRLGTLLKYIPNTLITGFTTGIAIVIFTSQMKDFLGLEALKMPEAFIEKWIALLHNIHEINPWALGIAGFVILMTSILPNLNSKFKKIPWAMIALVITGAVVSLLQIPVETLYTRFGELSATIPSPSLPSVNFETIKLLLVPAFSIALLGALESLLSCMIVDSMTGDKHQPNTELVAQGIANIFSPLFGGIPATGAIARTAANVNNGAKTPLSGVVHALVLLIIFLIAMPIVGYIPMAALAGILIVVALKMAHFGEVLETIRVSKEEGSVLVLTALLTVFTDITISIPVGLLAAILLFMKRISGSLELSPILYSKTSEGELFSKELGNYSSEITVLEISGPLFFGSIEKFIHLHTLVPEKTKYIILRFQSVPMIDLTGLSRLKEIKKDLTKMKIDLLISDANEQVAKRLVRYGLFEKDHVRRDIKETISWLNKR